MYMYIYIHILKVGAKDEMDRAVFLKRFNEDMKEERLRMTIVQKERDELIANKEFADNFSFDMVLLVLLTYIYI
jgi:hypothetical protein